MGRLLIRRALRGCSLCVYVPAVVALAVVHARAQALPPGLELSWRAPADCPQAAEMRATLAALLADAPRPALPALRVDVVIKAVGTAGYRLELRFAGDRSGVRRLEAPVCDELAHAAAVLTTLAIGPQDVPPASSAPAKPGVVGRADGDAPPRAPSASTPATSPRSAPRQPVPSPLPPQPAPAPAPSAPSALSAPSSTPTQPAHTPKPTAPALPRPAEEAKAAQSPPRSAQTDASEQPEQTVAQPNARHVALRSLGPRLQLDVGSMSAPALGVGLGANLGIDWLELLAAIGHFPGTHESLGSGARLELSLWELQALACAGFSGAALGAGPCVGVALDLIVARSRGVLEQARAQQFLVAPSIGGALRWQPTPRVALRLEVHAAALTGRRGFTVRGFDRRFEPGPFAMRAALGLEFQLWDP